MLEVIVYVRTYPFDRLESYSRPSLLYNIWTNLLDPMSHFSFEYHSIWQTCFSELITV